MAKKSTPKKVPFPVRAPNSVRQQLMDLYFSTADGRQKLALSMWYPAKNIIEAANAPKLLAKDVAKLRKNAVRLVRDGERLLGRSVLDGPDLSRLPNPTHPHDPQPGLEDMLRALDSVIFKLDLPKKLKKLADAGATLPV